MKIKSVMAAAAAVCVLTAGSVSAFADESAVDSAISENNADDNSAETVSGEDASSVSDLQVMPVSADIGEAPLDNPDTGFESIAAVIGAVALAGAAVVMSRKKD